MVKLRVNTLADVVVSTAGFGSRMWKVSPDLHKCLLPYQDKPILWHIIYQIPKNLNLAIILGHNSQQVRDFCSISFPERNIQYVNVDDWTSELSGTAYSLTCAKDALKETFWYLPCDGIFTEDIFNNSSNQEEYFVKEIVPDVTHVYTTFSIADGRIKESFQKLRNVSGVYAFTGIMKISNRDNFFNRLLNTDSSEFTASIMNGSEVRHLESWMDLGNPQSYEEALKKSMPFDFSKTDEYTYILGNQIIKWWPDKEIPQLKMKKVQNKPAVFPKKISAVGQFLHYEKSIGDSLYKNIDANIFDDLLNWLNLNLWTRANIDISSDCIEFYKKKTLARIALLESRLVTDTYHPKSVNGIKVKDWSVYLEQLDWDALVLNSVTSVTHGDLQFDNIIHDSTVGSFVLIDWRPVFGKQNVLGDLYYDLGKMLGGIRLNYLEVKRNNFEFQSSPEGVTLNIPKANEADTLERVLKEFVEREGLDWRRVQHLVPLIYWNMSPLHQEPFSNFLWCLGLYYFEKLDQNLG